MYTITINEDRRFIEVKLEGLCSMEEFRTFVDALRAAIAAFPGRGPVPATLYDFTGAAIQRWPGKSAQGG